MSINNYYYIQIERQITVVYYKTMRLFKSMIIDGDKKWKKVPDYEYNFISCYLIIVTLDCDATFTFYVFGGKNECDVSFKFDSAILGILRKQLLWFQFPLYFIYLRIILRIIHYGHFQVCHTFFIPFLQFTA